MKSSWSLAFLAGGAIAAPATYSTSCTEESETSPSTYASSTSTIVSPHSYPAGNSSWAPHPTAPVYKTSSAPVGDYETTVTEMTTIYTTICPTTALTYVESGTKKITTYIQTTPVVTVYTSTYVTPCPGTSTEVHDGTTVTMTYESSSTVTGVYTSTISKGAGGPEGYSSASWVTVPWGTQTFSYTVPPLPTETSVHVPGYGYPSGSGSASYSYPAGNGTSSAWGTGTGVHSATGTSTSTSSSATPTQTEACVPCKGQPGNNPDEYCGYTINDNWYEVMPITCRTREYFFTISNTTVSPDGVERLGLLVNGQMPGPKIEAGWGDTIVVHLTNGMQDNGTSIHFHGMRQNYTNEMDGVPSITQCALAPGESMTYTFKASNYGTSWYHSHFALQTYEGVFGPMVIHGPAAAEYDFEETVLLQDWSHATVDSMYQAAQSVGPSPAHGPRTLDTGLINGMNVFGQDGAANATGQRWTMIVIPGKTYRIRLVNVAIQSTFKFYIDGHKFKVIAADYVPIQPYETEIVNINIGQRYDLIFTADQPIGNYWMRSDNQNACAQITEALNIKGVVSYVGAIPFTTPTSTAYTYTEECVDEPLASLIPIVPINAGAQDQTIAETVVVGANGGTPNLFKWTLSGTTFQSQWGDPSLYGISKNGSVPDYSGNLAIEVPNLKEWVYIVIDSPIPLPHPIHLHGHDFLVLAQGTGLYSSSVVLNTVNPPRRDVALMPWDPVAHTGGHLVLAFETDNPGAWLMHCHIGWHTSMGFALQIIENLPSIKDTIKDQSQMDDTCSSWNAFASGRNLVVDDSGV